MGVKITIIHAVIAFLTFIYFIPKRTDVYGDFYYESEFNDNFPLFSKTGYWFFLFFIIYITIDCLLIHYFYIDYFEDSYFLIIIATLAIPIFCILCKIYYDELSLVSDKFKEKRPYTVMSIYLYLYAISVLTSCTLIYNANHFLDNSTPDEHIVTVLDLRSYVEGSGKFKVRYYDLKIDPPVCGYKNIYVPKDFYRKCQKGVKVKFNVGKGLLWQRYITKNMSVMK